MRHFFHSYFRCLRTFANSSFLIVVIANEFVAYEQLQSMVAAGTIGERTLTIASYAVCGFGNIASLGIQIGVFSGLATNQKVGLMTMI